MIGGPQPEGWTVVTMEFLSPGSWPDALAARSAHPDAVAIAGGTDVMVEINFDRHRPPELADLTPGLAMAARTVGSPQIRARGTVGGNLGSASPAGDCHPVLLAVDAV